MRRAPPAATSRPRLNVLLVTLDTTRADHIGCYGYLRAQTPRLDRLAAEGARFADASSPVPVTLAAHASLFTGLYPFEHGVRGNGDFYLADRFDTLATRLRAAGYRTAAFVSAFVLDRRYGLGRGFDLYDDRTDVAPRHVVDLDAERRGDHTLAVLAHWLDTSSRDRAAPFFAWLHLYDPHTPYSPPAPFAERFAGAPYDGEIAFDDTLVGSVLDKLGDLGLRETTLVVVVGDHGESLGDHGENTHSMFVYESAIRVPLVIWGRGVVRPGTVVREPVRLTDVAPTILELVGEKPLVTRSGRSLVPALEGRPLPAEPLYAETLTPQLTMNWAMLRSIRDDRWKFVDAPRREMYDLRRDPGERANLAADQPQKAGALAALLARVAGSGQGALSRAAVDQETKSRLAALGYIGAGMGAALAPSGTARDPKDFIGVYNRLEEASRAARARQFDQALPILQQVLATDAGNAFALLTLGDVYAGLRNDRKAIECYRRYLNAVPPAAYVHQLIAVCLLRLGRQKEAMEEAAAALAIDPKFTDSRILRASVLEQTGRYDAAIAEFRTALENDPAKLMIRLDLAKVFLEAGRLDDAQHEYETVLAQQPQLGTALADVAVLYMKQGKREAARSALQRALAIDPSLQEARFNLARLDEGEGRTADALAGYRQLVESAATAPDLRRAATERMRALARSVK
jgi:arylsulfatase A-like enzyme/Tfp pilus assembly protein PilF